MWQWFGRVLVATAGAVLVASYAGSLHSVGDSLAVFRPILLWGVIVSGVLVWRWRVAQVLIIISIVCGAFHFGAMVPHARVPGAADFTIYQKNMLFLPRDRTELIADIRAVGADVVTLQEVSHANLPTLAALRAPYLYQMLCNGHTVGAVAVLSKTPLTGQDCSDHYGFARAVTQVKGQVVQVIAIHLHWPWPYGQRDHLLQLLETMAPLDGAQTVVAGDFNMVASGRAIAWVEQATMTERVGPLVKTFDLFGYPLGIDHVLATGGSADLTVRPQLGSDHYGLVAGVSW